MIRYIFATFLILIAASLRATTTVLTDGDGDDADTSKIRNIILTEVSVNANKEPLTARQLPTSVTILGKRQLDDYRPQSLREISLVTPNLFMPDYGSKLTAPIYIRGIGSRINSPSVGLYVDNVPYMEKSAFDFDFFEVERIEVLRGPQGTLYGRNTMGGIILVQTRSPFESPGLMVRATAGNYGLYDINAGWHNSVNDRFGYSLSVNKKHRDGYYRNDSLNSKVDDLDSWSARNKLIWNNKRNLSIENTATIEHSEQGGYPYALYDRNTGQTKPISYDRYSFYNRKLFSDALMISWRKDWFELTSTTSFQYMDDDQHIDQDFLVLEPANQLDYYVVQKQRQDMVSQELIFKSRGEHRYKWVGGIFGFAQGMNTNVVVNDHVRNTKSDKTNDITSFGGALFHQSFLQLAPRLTVGVGLRFDIESSELHHTLKTGNQTSTSLKKDTIYPTLDSHELMPRFSATYRLNDGSIYAVAAKGYKTGGFNSIVERPEDLRFNSENSWNYELGYKFSAFKRIINGDISLFYIDWRKQQIYQTVPSGTGSMIKNAGRSRSQGLEVSLSSTPIAGFDFSISYGFTDAIFNKYEQDSLNIFNNNTIPYAPKNTLMVQANKNIDLNGFAAIDYLRLSATYRGAGRIYWNDSNSDYQNYYGLFDASVTANFKSIKASVWARNIFDCQYQAFFFSALKRNYVQKGQPATVGITIEYRLNK
jgi:outer membrane receptor protein involved in Fe transport